MQHEAKHCRIEMRAQIINDEHGGSGTKGGNDQEPHYRKCNSRGSPFRHDTILESLGFLSVDSITTVGSGVIERVKDSGLKRKGIEKQPCEGLR